MSPDRVWFGTGFGARLARAALTPAELLYSAVVGARGALYDRGVLRAAPPALPVLGIGNLTVGGTGKTPVAAWAAAELVARGGRPAIVLRGYGDDEPKVHALLNPGVPVVVAPVRVSGVQRAREQGCDVAVLDDAFQHRQIGRAADWVLISADRWTDDRRLLPAGPWREPVSSLSRATIAIVTRKAAGGWRAREVVDRLAVLAPGTPTAVIHLEPAGLRPIADTTETHIPRLDGARVLLIAGIGDPDALRQQLEEQGARVRAPRFGDHHAFTPAEISTLAASVQAEEIVVCTLKDAVKIGAGWPRAAPALWYVSQRVTVEEGADSLAGSLDALLRARSLESDSAHRSRPHL